ncbi:MAG: hypothetical protein JNM22_02515 [Saprospiraceae bacterium]|nr:hypothetical protein [Saprospiraceae bacterium]
MTKTTLTLFWGLWLLNVLAALYGWREFLQGVFGQYAAPTSRYILLWTMLMAIMLVVLAGSIYLKNHGWATAAISLVSGPLVVALPYLFWLAVMLVAGRNARWN